MIRKQEEEESISGIVRAKVKDEVQMDLLRRQADKEIEKVKGITEQVSGMAKWNLGIISGLALLLVTWLWQITGNQAGIRQALDKYTILFDTQTTGFTEVRGQIRNLDESLSRFNAERIDLTHRINAVENTAIQERQARENSDTVILERLRLIELRNNEPIGKRDGKTR